jgi:hypothetical protein|tara:strand:- start:447 stop:650 length:204 start_codon:yes stop_codon:yes gene_type:complete
MVSVSVIPFCRLADRVESFPIGLVVTPGQPDVDRCLVELSAKIEIIFKEFLSMVFFMVLGSRPKITA